jgi:glycine/D-amino acid oxidase-like deaminating enzyme/nitrite reductase/ring-hydroxylating ferredoxin subunit
MSGRHASADDTPEPREESLWLADRTPPSFPALDRDIEVDVAIVGGGITGLSSALMLAEAGKRVAILEQRRLAGGETGHTTAHLTELLDTPYLTIDSRFGREAARLAAEGSAAAIETCEASVRQHRIDCGFERVPAYLFTEDTTEMPELQEEAEEMALLGRDAAWTAEVPVPFSVAGGIRVNNQAQMDAYAYCLGLVDALTKLGVQIYESTTAADVREGEPSVVETASGLRVRADAVIVAGHVPINNRVLLHTKIAAYRTYVIAAEARELPAALLFDTVRPYHYLRSHVAGSKSYLLAGGEDHRTGMHQNGQPYARLKRYLSERFPGVRIGYRWSGQIIEPVDGLPYIGPNALQSRIFVATGYAGNGITFGILAGLILRDAILKKPNRFAALFDATRLVPLKALGTYVRENAPFPVILARDRLAGGDVDSGDVSSIAHGEGKVIRVNGETAAVSRGDDGRLLAVSAICTHLGCDVRWNDVDKTWDCPCHGSRFARDGRVLNGPAVTALARVDLT